MGNTSQKTKCLVCSLALAGLLSFTPQRDVQAQVASESLRPSAKGKLGMVTSANPLASMAGQKVLARGGNAIDAIVTTAAALNSVEPYMSGTAGVGYMLFYSAEEDRVRSLVFGGWVPENFDPAALAEDLAFADGAGHGTVETIGPRTAAVPGNLAGWARALEDYGTISLAEAFAPAIEYLEEGIPVTEYDQAMWNGTVDRVKPHKYSNEIYLKEDDTPYQIGDIFKNERLAHTMTRIAAEGIDIFYRGEIAKEIADAFREDGGFINENDLASVPDKVQWTEPVSIDYKGYTIYNNPPPGLGIQQLQTLKIMEEFNMKEMGHNSPDYLAHLLEAIHLSRMDVDAHVGDPAYIDVPVERLLSDSHIAQQRERVIARVEERKQTGTTDRPARGYIDDITDPKYSYATTSLSAYDQWGNAVVITQTLGGGFGSGYVAGETGLAFNNAMEWMYMEPGMPNSVEPGKGVGWSIGGMLQVHKDGKPQAIIGSPGSYGILQSVPQIAFNILEFDMTIQEAIDAPRFRWKDEHGSIPATEIIMETRVPEEVRYDLTHLGFDLDTRVGEWSMSVGGVQGIIIDHETGWIEGGADPRRNGYALGW